MGARASVANKAPMTTDGFSLTILFGLADAVSRSNGFGT